MQRAVFLDRDGVLNRVSIRAGLPIGPSKLDAFVLLPGVAESVERLRQAGYRVIVVTNQPDIARKRLDLSTLAQMHARLRAAVSVDAIYVCPHDDENRCECRKPKIGMIESAARDFGIDLSGSFMVGDRWRDIEAGKKAGCRTILVDYAYCEPLKSEPDGRVANLAEAVEIILAHRVKNR